MKNTILEAKCIDMTFEGFGVCKVDDLIIFTKGMITEDIAKIKIISHKKNLCYAIIDELIKSSPYRIKPDCVVASKCGGCDLRHVDYNYQLKLKKDWVIKTIKTIANLELEVKDCVGSLNENHYRNKVQIPVNNGMIGFYRNNSHDIVECDNCMIQSELTNEIIKFLKEELISNHYDKYFRHILIKHAFNTNEVMIAFITNKETFKGLDVLVDKTIKRFKEVKSLILNLNIRNDNVIIGDKEIVLYGNSYITDELNGIKFNISLKSFYQINSVQTVNLYNEVIKRADINKNTRVLDLYSGIGSIALYIARNAKEAVGVEIVKEAVENARENAKINNIENAKFILADAADNLGTHLIDKDVVIVDPPRKGLNKSVIEDIVKSNINKVVYVSCNPATLARDIAIFSENNYIADYVQPFDMFPGTCHVETVVLMSKVNDNK